MGTSVGQETVSAQLAQRVANARVLTSDGGGEVTANEARTIVQSLITNGVAIADLGAALAQVPGLSAKERATLGASHAQLTQVRAHAAVFSSGFGVQASLVSPPAGTPVARLVRPASVAQQIPALVRKALAELQQGNVAAAATTLAPLANPGGDGWEVRASGAWLGGADTHVAAVLSALSVSAPVASLVGTLVRQTQVHAEMSAVLKRPASMPPSLADVRDYGAALAKQKPRPTAEDIGDAFTRYAVAFHRHPGPVTYPASPTAAFALPPHRAVGSDGLSTNNCVGHALLAHAFLTAAGFRCQYVHIDSTAPGLPGHGMVYATRGSEALVTSNHEHFTGPTGNPSRDALVAQALRRTAGKLAANSAPPAFLAALPL